jgi:hypothetical protein
MVCHSSNMQILNSSDLITCDRRRAYILKAKDLLVEVLGWGLELIHSPARLKAFEFVDPETDETVYLYTSRLYSVLCIGSRRFHFNRITGKYDGISALPNCVARRIELAD